MREVKVDREELLGKITANREAHIAEYNESVEGYRKAVEMAVDKAVKELNVQRTQVLETKEPVRLEPVMFNLAVPQSHEKDYDQVIAMLEMSKEDTLTIRSDEFACYVMDDWDWKNDFEMLNSSYKSNRR